MRSWYRISCVSGPAAAPVRPAFARPAPQAWDDSRLTAAWLGHATVLINFFGFRILTDPVLFPRIGVRFPGFTIGPKRLTAPALPCANCRRSIWSCSRTRISIISICARSIACRARPKSSPRRARSDLLRWTRFRSKTRVALERNTRAAARGGRPAGCALFRCNHWGARLQYDNYRGYNGYILERNGTASSSEATPR